MTREELKAKIREKKIKRAFKIMRFRSLKNFFIWLTGAMMSFVIFFLTVFVAVGVVPIGTYTGGDSDSIVGKDISNKSIYQAIADFNTYKIGDIPALANALETMINEAGLDQYVHIDTDKLNNIKFVYDDGSTDFMTELTSCIKVTASIETVMSATDGSSGLGDFGNLSVFSSYGEIVEFVKVNVKTDDNGLVNDDPENPLNAENYYYFDSVNGIYSRAFDTSGAWVDGIGEDKPDVLYVKNKDLPKVDSNGNITKNAEGEFNSNPKLYYYDANSVEIEEDEGDASPKAEEVKEPNWQRVFDDEGKRLAPENVKLHYANLSKVPILEAIDLIDESLGRLELTELLETFGAGDMASEDSLLGSILGDKSVGDMASIGTSDIFLSKILPATEEDVVYKIMTSATGKAYDQITVDDLTGANEDGSAKLDITRIGLSSLLEASEDDIINKILTSATNKPYDQITVDDLTGTNDDGTPKLDINRIGIGMLLEASEDDIIYKIMTSATGKDYGDITIDDLTGTNDDGSAKLDIAKINLSVLLEAEEGDLIYDIMTSATGKDYDKITVDDLTSGLEISNVNLSVLLEADEEDIIYKIMTSATGKDYDKITVGDLTGEDSEGNPILDIAKVSLSVLLEAEEGDLIYDIMTSATGKDYDKITVNDLTSGLEISNVSLSLFLEASEDDVIYKIMTSATGKPYGEITIADLTGKDDDGNPNLDINNVSLSVLLDAKAGDVIYDIMTSATNKPYDQITVSDLTSGLEIENVNLSVLLEADEEDIIYKIMTSATGKPYGEITIADLTGKDDDGNPNLDINNVSLSVLLDAKAGDMIYDIMTSATGKPYAEITVGDLSSGLEIDNVNLSVLLDASEGDMIYDILTGATGKPYSEITVGDLTGEDEEGNPKLDINKVAIGTIMTGEDNQVVDMLVDMINEKREAEADGEEYEKVTAETLTIGDIQSVDTSYIKLTSFMPYYEVNGEQVDDNRELYKILLEASGKTLTKVVDGEVVNLTDDEIKVLADDLSLSNLTFDIDNVKLSTVMTADEKLQKVLSGALNGKAFSDISIADLGSEDFSIDNVKLADVMDVTGTLKDILDQAFDTETEDKSFADIAIKDFSGTAFNINNVKLSTVMTADAKLQKVLSGALNGKEFDKISIADLSSEAFSIDNVKLSVVMETTNEKLQNILSGALNNKPYADITIADLGGASFNIDNVKLSAVMTANDKLQKVLSGALNDKPYAEITIADLSSEAFSIDNVKLSAVMGDVNENLKNILDQAFDTETENKDFEDITIKDFAGTGFNINQVKLSTVMQGTNAKLKNILSGALGGKDYSDITIADLSGTAFDINNVKLSVVMDSSNEKLQDILSGALGGKTYGEITIADLGSSSFNIDNVKLSVVMSANTKLQNILSGALGGKAYADITIADLGGQSFNIDNVKLSVVMDSSNETLKNLLSGALNNKPYADITIADLGSSTFNIDNVKLSTVLPYKDSAKNIDNSGLYRILLDCNGMLKSTDTDTEISAKAQSLSISDINNFSINNVKLSTVLTSPDASLKAILEDVYVNHTVGVNSYEDITLAMLAEFKMGDLHLQKVLPEPSGNLKLILEDAFDCDYNEITVSKLSGDGFNFNKISLKTVVGETSSNPIIQALIESGSSVGGIGDAINELSLYKVYGANVFVTTPVENAPRYNLSADGKTYTLDVNGEYYLSKDAGIWLLLCFNSGEIVQEGDNAGRAMTYTISSATINDLQGGEKTDFDITLALMGATGRQLQDAGIVKSVNEALWTHTMYEVFNPEIPNIQVTP